MFQGKAKDMCATAQRKSLLRKLKLICISHCAHIQTCPKPYVEITQIHKACATNTACTHTHTHQPFHLNLTPHNTHSPPTHISMYPPAAPQQCPHKGKSILFFIKNTVIPVVPSHGSEHIFWPKPFWWTSVSLSWALYSSLLWGSIMEKAMWKRGQRFCDSFYRIYSTSREAHSSPILI